MLADLKSQIQSHLESSLRMSFPSETQWPSVELELPAEKVHGEFSCNIALKSARILKKSPLDIAAIIARQFEATQEGASFKDKVAKVEVKSPGFINFFLSPHAFYEILTDVFKDGALYGQSDFGQKKKIQIEFVSANPTGPLSVAHARQAAVGDALANILNFVGFDARKEYYVNDEGNQINLLGDSVRIRARELLNPHSVKPEELSEDHYHGAYIVDIARQFIEEKNIKTEEELSKRRSETTPYAVDYLMAVIKKDLDDFGVRFDTWSYQSKIATRENIERVLQMLKNKNYIYEKDGASWFQSTVFGDDKDRVVQKSDGSFTYLMPDIVYHKDKFERGFDRLINIWGPDHHGYIPRIKASVEALGRDKEALDVLIVQLATIYKEGKAVSMSTRRGQYISLREIIDEVGGDAARFFFLMRHIEAHLDFDLELAKKETPENPVYYIQYAHARIHSINKKAESVSLAAKESGFSRLKEEEGIDLIKKLGIFPDTLMFCYYQLDPFPLVIYLQELATLFHKFYDNHRVIDQDLELSSERLALINAVRIVLANGLRLLGVSIPEKM
ncbi:MAG TPA: arginine--tRNA ligase [Candidatus Omnitrophica bacterium]|nr:MAG: arginine--tRNA ligase [Omnitrophica WOR_2 bacterium GWA2_45_18]OGX21070.1 MAG: arginine--tRNA ligase [Omnitrophica WOR_2 bacterium GWC2_45_7]HBR13933.1 arginine--tRNA ligase [Candidatus Omnitrophota bacterium]